MSNKQQKFLLGFLTAIELPDRGYVGGLLITTCLGRPLEFQCTTPVKPNRTQEILYGPTLVPFLLSELIGQTLIDRCQVKPHLLIVERDELGDLDQQVEIPVGRLVDREPNSNDSKLPLGRQAIQFTTPPDESLRTQLTGIPADADMQEPFERIRQALREALKAAA